MAAKEDFYEIGNLYTEMYEEKTDDKSSLIKEDENFFTVEDDAQRLDGDLDNVDLDNDGIPDRLDGKIFVEFDGKLGQLITTVTEEIMERFGLEPEEARSALKKWFQQHI